MTKRLGLVYPRLLVGDWSGTFIDKYSRAPVIAFDRLFKAHRIDVPLPVIRNGMGHSKIDHIRMILAVPNVNKQWVSHYGRAPNETDISLLYKEFQPMQLSVLSEYKNVTPLPHVIETLDELRNQYGMAVGLTTGFDSMMSDQILHTLKKNKSPLLSRIDCVVPVREGIRGRPYPDGIQEIMSKMDVQCPKSVWKIDDTPVGIEEGKNAGCVTAGVYEYSSEMGKYMDHIYTNGGETDNFLVLKGCQNAQKALSEANYVVRGLKQLMSVITPYFTYGHKN